VRAIGTYVCHVLMIHRGLMGRRDEGHWTVPRTAPSERHCQDPERHQGWQQDGQEAGHEGQGGGRGEAVER
jgi:hypothetical protein